MQVAEQELAFAQQFQFVGLRLLNLDHQLGCPGFGGGGDDGRAGGTIGVVGEPRLRAGAGLEADLVAGAGQCASALGGECHPVFVVLDFLGNADVHGAPRGSRVAFRI